MKHFLRLWGLLGAMATTAAEPAFDLLDRQIQEAADILLKKQTSIRKQNAIIAGYTADFGYAKRCRIWDPDRKEICENFMEMIAPEYRIFADLVRKKLATVNPFPAAPPIPAEKLWLWGGPTPEWGGSPRPDTLLKTAKWFGIDNGIYVYGPTTEEMIALHAPLKKMIAMVTSTCRAPGQQPESDAECAEKLSRLSLKYPNITGGMMDDMTNSCLGSIPPEKIEAIAGVSRALKKHNPALKLYGTVYQHELKEKDFSPLLPYLDGINLWFWRQEQLLQLEGSVELARQKFPGKEILLGIFLHDYGTADAGAMIELLIYQFQGARALLASGKIDALVILGDREILKWPAQAAVAKGMIATP